MKLKLVSLLLLLFAVATNGQTNREPKLKDLNVDFMLRGYFFAGSKIEDKNALGGFGPSDNLPKPIEAGRDLPANKVSLVALPDEETIFGNQFRGMKVLLANTTSETARFAASDSRLYIVQEAIDGKGRWRPVEYLPSSWCGNSYHSVFLAPNEYWEFAAAKLNGKFKTRLRFRLEISEGEKKTFMYSNEFEGSINPRQFTVQEGHTPAGIMDPYNN